MKLKEFKTPTDVVIIPGSLFNGKVWYGDAMITDGEHDFVVTVNNEIMHRLTSNGYINVISKQTFDENRTHISEELIDGEFLYLPNFQGEIGIKVVFVMSGKDNIHIEKLDLDEYLMHQEDFALFFDDKDFKKVEYCITLPKGTEICEGTYDENNDKFMIKQLKEI